MIEVRNPGDGFTALRARISALGPLTERAISRERRRRVSSFDPQRQSKEQRCEEQETIERRTRRACCDEAD